METAICECATYADAISNSAEAIGWSVAGVAFFWMLSKVLSN